MPRIRSIHPGQWTDEEFVTCSPLARLLSLAVRNEADDQGVFEWKPLTLKMRIFPADAVDIDDLLQELIDNNQVEQYEVNGKRYGIIRNFLKYQRPKKPNAIHPLPIGAEPVDSQFRISSGKSPQRKEEGGRMEEVIGKVPAPPSEPPPPEDDLLQNPILKMNGYSATQAFEDYNALACRIGLPVAKMLTDERRKKIKARLRAAGKDGWGEALSALESSAFCTGGNDRGWRADLDFVLQEKSFNRLIEGAYTQTAVKGGIDWEKIHSDD